MTNFQFIVRKHTVESGIVSVDAETLSKALDKLASLNCNFEKTQNSVSMFYEVPSLYLVDGKDVTKDIKA